MHTADLQRGRVSVQTDHRAPSNSKWVNGDFFQKSKLRGFGRSCHKCKAKGQSELDLQLLIYEPTAKFFLVELLWSGVLGFKPGAVLRNTWKTSASTHCTCALKFVPQSRKLHLLVSLSRPGHTSCVCVTSVSAACLLIFSAPIKTAQSSHTARRRRTSHSDATPHFRRLTDFFGEMCAVPY